MVNGLSKCQHLKAERGPAIVVMDRYQRTRSGYVQKLSGESFREKSA